MAARLGKDDRQKVLNLASEGHSDAEIARRYGCSRQTVARIRQCAVASDRTSKGRIIQARVTPQEADAFATMVDEAGTTTSDMLRRMIRLSAGVADFRADELEELGRTSRELNALARNLVQLLRLGHVGKLRWNARDAALVGRLSERTEEVARAVQALRAASMRGAFVRTELIGATLPEDSRRPNGVETDG
ncbi:helix-turn-helix domain-containing protein [Jannaschia sp. M317]|uniref:helix-turn-helix domain-containing protein n=1 Tax=Jannaschia sp. M317 TaxID=2867011 RepID=UPI0021A3690E|nr:helix-turn-helix domain-containing protein [Jannaschia sp. M317]UWQ19734.1 helix-turn-helix domain-containing protein [Jannaschia sp. M317]